MKGSSIGLHHHQHIVFWDFCVVFGFLMCAHNQHVLYSLILSCLCANQFKHVSFCLDFRIPSPFPSLQRASKSQLFVAFPLFARATLMVLYIFGVFILLGCLRARTHVTQDRKGHQGYRAVQLRHTSHQ